MKSLRFTLWIAVTVAALVFIGLIFYKDTTTPSPIQPDFIAGFNKGTHFTLTDETGKAYNTATQFQDDDYALIFFGFTYCPAICPAELQKMATVLDMLDDDGKKIHPLFVSVDPERDTPEILKDYVTLFHPEIKGLTGTPDEVKAILNAWHVYAAKAEDPSMTDYTMDHSTYTYMVDKDMNILAVFRMNDTPEDIVRRIKEIIKRPMLQP